MCSYTLRVYTNYHRRPSSFIIYDHLSQSKPAFQTHRLQQNMHRPHAVFLKYTPAFHRSLFAFARFCHDLPRRFRLLWSHCLRPIFKRLVGYQDQENDKTFRIDSCTAHHGHCRSNNRLYEQQPMWRTILLCFTMQHAEKISQRLSLQPLLTHKLTRISNTVLIVTGREMLDSILQLHYVLPSPLVRTFQQLDYYLHAPSFF